MLETVNIIEQYEWCIAYDCDAVYYVELKAGTSISDHIHEHEETIFLMKGKAEMILGEEKQVVEAPAKLTIPSNVYHKFTAITDVIGLEIKIF